MADLKSKRLIYLKAALFVAIGLISSGLLFSQNPNLQTAMLLALVVWSFSRAYYFAFYVIERYVDPTFKFAGLCDAARYLMRKRF